MAQNQKNPHHRGVKPPAGFRIPWQRGTRTKILGFRIREHELEALEKALDGLPDLPEKNRRSWVFRRAINEFLARRKSWFQLEE